MVNRLGRVEDGTAVGLWRRTWVAAARMAAWSGVPTVIGPSDMPEFDVNMMDVPERGVLGLGEPPTIPTAAAIASGSTKGEMSTSVCCQP